MGILFWKYYVGNCNAADDRISLLYAFAKEGGVSRIEFLTSEACPTTFFNHKSIWRLCGLSLILQRLFQKNNFI